MKKKLFLKKIHKADDKIHSKIKKMNKEENRLHKNEEKLHEMAEKKERKPMKKKGEKKIAKVMREFEAGKLPSGSKKGPEVKKKSQAIAIALSEAKKIGAKIPKKKKK